MQHCVPLLEADLASVGGKPSAVVEERYENAIAIAGKMGFINNLGLSQERFGDHFTRRGELAAAKENHFVALESHRKIGAQGRASLMQQRHGLSQG